MGKSDFKFALNHVVRTKNKTHPSLGRNQRLRLTNPVRSSAPVILASRIPGISKVCGFSQRTSEIRLSARFGYKPTYAKLLSDQNTDKISVPVVSMVCGDPADPPCPTIVWVYSHPIPKELGQLVPFFSLLHPPHVRSQLDDPHLRYRR